MGCKCLISKNDGILEKDLSQANYINKSIIDEEIKEIAKSQIQMNGNNQQITNITNFFEPRSETKISFIDKESSLMAIEEEKIHTRDIIHSIDFNIEFLKVLNEFRSNPISF